MHQGFNPAGRREHGQLDRSGRRRTCKQIVEQFVFIGAVRQAVGDAGKLVARLAGAQIEKQLAHFDRVGQRGFGAGVEPSVDGVVEEFHREQVHHNHRRQGKRDEHADQPGAKPGAGRGAANIPNQAYQTLSDHGQQHKQRQAGQQQDGQAHAAQPAGFLLDVRHQEKCHKQQSGDGRQRQDAEETAQDASICHVCQMPARRQSGDMSEGRCMGGGSASRLNRARA